MVEPLGYSMIKMTSWCLICVYTYIVEKSLCSDLCKLHQNERNKLYVSV